MNTRLLETAVRPIRLAFLIGRNPSNRLLNSLISANSGLWGGIYNLLCPTNGSLLSDDYLQLLKTTNPDHIILCGRFNNRESILRQLEEQAIYPCYLHKNISLADLERQGIGVEGIFDMKSLQTWQRGVITAAAIVDPRQGEATILDKTLFGIPPNRLKEYIQDRFDLVTVHRYKTEFQSADPHYDELIRIVDVTGEGLNEYRSRPGRRLTQARFSSGWPYFVTGREDSIDDACYFWNVRAMFGPKAARWVPQGALTSIITQWQQTIRSKHRRVTITSISADTRQAVRQAIEGLTTTNRLVRLASPKALFRRTLTSALKTEVRREHTPTSGDEFVIPVRRPSSFELVYPRTYPHWVMDLRILRDTAIGTEGFILPSHSCLSEMMTPARASRLHPRTSGEVLSLQVSSAPADEYIKLSIPSDWEVIRTIFSQSGHSIGLSDQGKYLNRTLLLFSGLHRLSAFLRHQRVTAILDEFSRHHNTQLQAIGDYRRVLTLDNMMAVTMKLLTRRTQKKQDDCHRFVNDLVTDLMRIGALHSGYVLDCPHCSLEEWYPIDDVGESFRCRRCLATQTRPPAPSISFRLNEALYQAYRGNFIVPTLVLDTLHRETSGSYIFAPQVKLDATDTTSPEIDIVAICDGVLTVGEAKSTDKIDKKQLASLESTALRIKAQRVVVATNSRHTCNGLDCNTCSQNEYYADNAFSQASPTHETSRGTRERIQHMRTHLLKQDIQVRTICANDLCERELQIHGP